MFDDLQSFVRHLDEKGRLLTISEELSPRYEAAAVVREVDRRLGKAVLFRRLTGAAVPVVANILCRRDMLALAMGTEGDVTQEYIARRRNLLAPVTVANPPCQEIVHEGPIDLMKLLPLLTHHERDVSPYLSSAISLAQDPATGERGMGIHRVQVRGPNEVAIFYSNPPVGRFLKEYDERNERMEIALAVGLDPLSFFGSVVPLSEGGDKFPIIGALRGRPVEIARATSVNLDVFAHAEIILEGYVQPKVRVTDGPFGESTGYYITTQSALATITRVTHRRAPMYHALVPFAEENTLLMAIPSEADGLIALQAKFPNVRALCLTPKSVCMLAVVQVEQQSKEQNRAIIEEVLRTQRMVKTCILVDTDVDPYDMGDVQWAMSTRSQPAEAAIVLDNLPGFVIDPSVRAGVLTSKLGFDATRPRGAGPAFEKIEIPAAARQRAAQVLAGVM